MRDRTRIVIFSLSLLGLIIAYIMWGELLTLETVKKHQTALKSYTGEHYVQAVATFMSILVSTAFFVPGALVMSLLGGYLFGMAAVAYLDVGMTLGAVLAFLTARYIFGNRIRLRLARHFKLKSLDEELKNYGPNYLVVLRIVPVMPFFAVNYLAAMTTMSCLRFTASTALGILPGAFTYAYAGKQLSRIESLEGLVSPGMMLAMAAMAVLALLPAIISHFKRMFRSKK